jgi:trehalose/maltose hydrolase-like predicted phosphorylase
VEEWHPGTLPAYLSNGVVGIRVRHIPHLGGVAVVNGFAGVDGASGAETLARTPYPLAAGLSVDGLELDDARERARLVRQAYDFGTGELHSRFVFEADVARADVEVTTFCSRTLPTLVLQETVVALDRACDLVVAAGVDHRDVPGSLLRRRTADGSTVAAKVDGSLAWRSHGDLGIAGAAYRTEFLGADATRSLERNELRPLQSTYALRARTGRRYRLRQIAALVPDAMHSQPDLQAVRLCHEAEEQGFERLRAENREAWEDVWEGRVRIDAPAPWQELVDAAYFYLHASAHPSSPASTSMFGLAYWPDYHYYRGHVMWDIEAFVVPPLILTQPDAARTLLEYRSRHLPAARMNAAMHGFRGAQFPWESSIRDGDEAAPYEAAAAAHEHHVSMDVAFAFSQFLHGTHDWRWGREHGWPVLSEVAEWITSRGVETARGFEIHGVNGIAEVEMTVDNNAFVNMSASVALREAALLAENLGRAADPAWERLARSVFLPLDDRGVIRNHDAYRSTEEKGSTPEAPAGLFPLTFDCPPEVERATFDYYLRLADDYVGAPMLSTLLGVYAARLGDRGRSLELFQRGYADFIVQPFSITAEYAPAVFPEQPVAGPFYANLGGFLTSCLYGLTGLRITDGEPETWCARPVTPPSGWKAIEVDRIWARGKRASLTARHGDEHAALELRT